MKQYLRAHHHHHHHQQQQRISSSLKQNFRAALDLIMLGYPLGRLGIQAEQYALRFDLIYDHIITSTVHNYATISYY